MYRSLQMPSPEPTSESATKLAIIVVLGVSIGAGMLVRVVAARLGWPAVDTGVQLAVSFGMAGLLWVGRWSRLRATQAARGPDADVSAS